MFNRPYTVHLPMVSRSVFQSQHNTDPMAYNVFWALQWYTVFTDYFSLLTKYYSGDHIKKNDMARACCTYGKQERCIQGFGGKT